MSTTLTVSATATMTDATKAADLRGRRLARLARQVNHLIRRRDRFEHVGSNGTDYSPRVMNRAAVEHTHAIEDVYKTLWRLGKKAVVIDGKLVINVEAVLDQWSPDCDSSVLVLDLADVEGVAERSE